MGELALFQCLTKALTETQVTLVGSTVQELFDFIVTWAWLGRNLAGWLLENIRILL